MTHLRGRSYAGETNKRLAVGTLPYSLKGVKHWRNPFFKKMAFRLPKRLGIYPMTAGPYSAQAQLVGGDLKPFTDELDRSIEGCLDAFRGELDGRQL
jgi:hypothetical protein